jgi:hypothetical protein
LPQPLRGPRDLRNTTITIRHWREGIGFPPVVYQDGD